MPEMREKAKHKLESKKNGGSGTNLNNLKDWMEQLNKPDLS